MRHLAFLLVVAGLTAALFPFPRAGRTGRRGLRSHHACSRQHSLPPPIWGGNETLGKARAIENRVFVATSGYDYPTYVMDPDGELLALARDRGTLASATIDLNRRYVAKWLGDMRDRFMKELRLDVNVNP